MKRNQPKKADQNRCRDQQGCPNEFCDSRNGHSQNPFMQTVAVFIENGTRDNEWKQKVQFTRSNVSPDQLLYFAGGFSFLPMLGELRAAIHNLAGILLTFGIVLIVAGLFVWLIKWMKKQKCYPLEPFEPLWDPVGQLFYFGIVCTFTGFVFRIM